MVLGKPGRLEPLVEEKKKAGGQGEEVQGEQSSHGPGHLATLARRPNRHATSLTRATGPEYKKLETKTFVSPHAHTVAFPCVILGNVSVYVVVD